MHVCAAAEVTCAALVMLFVFVPQTMIGHHQNHAAATLTTTPDRACHLHLTGHTSLHAGPMACNSHPVCWCCPAEPDFLFRARELSDLEAALSPSSQALLTASLPALPVLVLGLVSLEAKDLVGGGPWWGSQQPACVTTLW